MKIKHINGFSLLEAVVYTGISSIVLLTVVSYVFWMDESESKSKASRETSENAKYAMEILGYEIRGATSIYTPATTPTQLSLETKQHLPEGETFSFVDFYICEDRLCMKKDGTAPVFLTSESIHIENLSFEILGGDTENDSVTVSFDAVYANYPGVPDNYSRAGIKSSFSIRSY